MLREKIARDINKMAMAKAAAGDDFRYLGPNQKTKDWVASRTADINGAIDYLRDGVGRMKNYSFQDFDNDAMRVAEGAGRMANEYGPAIMDAAEMTGQQISDGAGRAARGISDAGTSASEEAQLRSFLARQELDRLRQRVTQPVEEALGQVVDAGRSAFRKGHNFIDRLGSRYNEALNAGMREDSMGDELDFQNSRRAEIAAMLRRRPATRSIVSAIKDGPGMGAAIMSGARGAASSFGSAMERGLDDVTSQGLDVAEGALRGARGQGEILARLLGDVRDVASGTASAYNLADNNRMLNEDVDRKHQIVGILEAIRGMDADVKREEAADTDRRLAQINSNDVDRRIEAINNKYDPAIGAAKDQRVAEKQLAEREYDRAMAKAKSDGSRRYDILGEQDSLMAAGNDTGMDATIRELGGNLSGAVRENPEFAGALAAGAGGLGAAGILRLIKLLRGRGSAPAPI